MFNINVETVVFYRSYQNHGFRLLLQRQKLDNRVPFFVIKCLSPSLFLHSLPLKAFSNSDACTLPSCIWVIKNNGYFR